MKKFLRSGMLPACLSLVTAVFFLIYGIVNNYFDIVILLFELIAAVCFALYAKKDSKATDYLNLLAVVLLSFSLGLFFLNSYTVWADWYGHFDMYGSRGGIAPVIVQMVLLIVTIFMGIGSCFKAKGVKEGKLQAQR